MANCRSVRDGDEWYCPVAGCGLRWEVGEERPACMWQEPTKKRSKKP